jgi:hypothetical protein
MEKTKEDKKEEKPLSEEEKAKQLEEKKKKYESCLNNLVVKKGDYSIHVLIEQVSNLSEVKEK